MSSILNKLSGLKLATSENRKTPMTDAQVTRLKEQLKSSNRMNVYPNKFDIAKPYRVQVRKGSDWTTYGYFTDVDVAAAVGSICSLAVFGDKALRGEFDQEKAENHEEFQAWLADERNQEVIAAVSV